MDKSIIGLITARGASKGIPRKNIANAGGRPLLAWTIEAARASRHLSRTIVSTDCQQVADVASKWGAQVPFMRPKRLARDGSPHIDVVLHAIEWLSRHERFRPNYVVLLQPTSPLRTAEDIDGAIDLALDRQPEAVVSVVESHMHPYLTRRMTDDGILKEFIPNNVAYPRRQDLPAAYFINGAVYVNRCDALEAKRTFYPEDLHGYVMPAERSLQVDSPWDLHVADLILREREDASDA